VVPRRRRRRPAQTVRVTTIAQDPSVKDKNGRIVTGQLQIPAEHLEPGPRGARFQVFDYDGDRRKLIDPAVFDLEDGDPYRRHTQETLTTDPSFRALNVYAIAARTLALFENALGRRLDWASGGHQLNLVPRAFPELNAFYSPDEGAVFFGFQEAAGQVIHTALSHDIIAHEVTHAILDGLRPRFNEPGLPDQPAFHEALGDIVAMLAVFSVQSVVEHLLARDKPEGPLNLDKKGLHRLRYSALLGLADELAPVSGERGNGLRRSVELSPSREYLHDPEYDEPHRRGEIVVAAVMQALLAMWTERLRDFLGRSGEKSKIGPSRARLAEEGARAADQLLRMVIRGIDYMPPVELELGDVIDAITKADEVVAPDDQRHYRETLVKIFSLYGIDRPAQGIVDVSRKRLTYARLNYTSLRASPDEVFRFIWDNADDLVIDRRWNTRVTSVRPSVRVGPDGLIVNEVVAEYTQTVNLTVADLSNLPDSLRFDPPAGMRPDTKLQFWGGGVLVFDQFGRAKYHTSKPLGNANRQQRRLQHLYDQRMTDEQERYGYELAGSRGQRFAALHVSDDHARERW
jgi:hypothetical protein